MTMPTLRANQRVQTLRASLADVPLQRSRVLRALAQSSLSSRPSSNTGASRRCGRVPADHRPD